MSPFLNKKENETPTWKDKGILQRRLYLHNVPYDATVRELEELVGAFVPVDYAVVPRDHGGLARGYAFVFLEKAEDLDKAIEYVSGRHIRSRQI